MKLTSRYKNPLPEFVDHGVKEIGNYIYILKIDLSGQAIIKRAQPDGQDISFTRHTTGTLPDFWTDPTVHVYDYIHKI
ncbi:MAG TPA: hypothetical protein ENI61_01145 [Ignavibacteria bacterium]|nr:hypothetical protein [Ignavibacteria bacterium]